MSQRSPSTEAKTGGTRLARRMYASCLLAVVVMYALSGLTIVKPSEVAIVLRLGQLRTAQGKPLIFEPGLLIAWPQPFDQVICVPVKEERSIQLTFDDTTYDQRILAEERRREAQEEQWDQGLPTEARNSQDNSITTQSRPAEAHWVLTGDRQALAIGLKARYRITDPVAYSLQIKAASDIGQRVVRAAATKTLSRWSADEAMRLRIQRLRVSQSGMDHAERASIGSVDQEWITANLPADPTAKEAQALMSEHWDTAQTQQRLRNMLDNAAAPVTLSEAIRRVAQQQFDAIGAGLELTALEIQSVKPPTQSTLQAFEAVQSARIAQQTLIDRARGDGQSDVINKQLLAQEYVADAKGKMSSRRAEATELTNEFLAALDVIRRSDRTAAQRRMLYQAWEEIIDSAQELILVSPGGKQETRLRIESPRGRR